MMASSLAPPAPSGGAWASSFAPPAPSGGAWASSFAPPAPSGGAWGDASPQTPAKRTSRVSWHLDMGNSPRFPQSPQSHAPRLAVTPAVPNNATTLTSTRAFIRHTLFLAGVWGEASPQAPPEARWTVGPRVGPTVQSPWAGGARREGPVRVREARREGPVHVREARRGRLLCASLAAAVGFTLCPALALACARDGVPSVSADGRLAVLNRTAAPAVLTTWSPFVFARPVPRGHTVTLAENNREIANAHVLPSDVFTHPWQWTFGDGRPDAYGTRVRHTYSKAGTYRIEVRAYYAAYASWQPFDVVTVHVR